MDAFVFWIAIVSLVWYLALWAIGLLGCHVARQRYRRRPRSPLASSRLEQVEGVSILRPLKGLETNLYENLESTFKQEYPNLEILLSVDSDRDQALPTVRELLAKYPSVNARVIIGEEIVDVNPKVNNLVRSYREASHDILWVLDSNVKVSPGTLARSVDALGKLPFDNPEKPSNRRIGLVHHVPFAVSTMDEAGAELEEAFLNTNHAKMYLAINAVAIDSCVVGKSNMYRRSDLDRCGGIAAFGRYLPEDNMIAHALWHQQGLRHDLSCDVAYNAVGSMSVRDYIFRRIRWIRVRKHMVTAATLIEPLTESLTLSILGSWAISTLLSFPQWLVMIIHYVLWIAVDLDVYSSLAGYPLPSSSRVKFCRGWILRELLALPIWVMAIVGSRVEWRGTQYRVFQNGEVERIVPTRGSSWWKTWKASSNNASYCQLSPDPTS